jgi:hypothetical protein
LSPPIQVTAYEVRSPDGALSAALRTEGSPTDQHDLVELPSGNFLLLTYRVREGVDLSPYGGPADAAIFDSEVQKITREGNVLWRWNSADQVSPDETEGWWEQVLARPDQVDGVCDVYDPTHINSAEKSGRGVIVSLRHTDAVYRIAHDGQIDWKLGGTPTPQSLEVRGDPVGGGVTFGGQHDARLLDDLTLTVHDNGSLKGRPPRSVRFEIDKGAGTATLLESNADPANAPISACCGSSRLTDGSWVTAWGGGNFFVAEYGPDGEQTWRMDTPLLLSYRAIPVEPGFVSDGRLRAGMNAMYLRRPRECPSGTQPGPAGTPDDDRLVGAETGEFIVGLAGDDRIRGRGGLDCLLGEGGGDGLRGGSGIDLLAGGPGGDRLRGGVGRDLLKGGSGNDLLRGGDARDDLLCGAGRDVAIAGPGDKVSRGCERVLPRSR